MNRKKRQEWNVIVCNRMGWGGGEIEGKKKF